MFSESGNRSGLIVTENPAMLEVFVLFLTPSPTLRALLSGTVVNRCVEFDRISVMTLSSVYL